MVLAVQIFEPFAGHVGVYLGRRQVTVSQQHLHDTQVSTTIQEVRCKRMAQAVRRHLLAHTGFLGVALDDVPEGLAGHAVAAASREQIISLALKKDLHAGTVAKFFQPTLRFFTQRDQAFAVALADDTQDALIEMPSGSSVFGALNSASTSSSDNVFGNERPMRGIAMSAVGSLSRNPSRMM